MADQQQIIDSPEEYLRSDARGVVACLVLFVAMGAVVLFFGW